VAGKLAVEERIRPADALLVLLVGGQRQRLLELLEQRLRLQLGLDRDLLGDRDQEAAALDQPADDVLVAALHDPRLSPSCLAWPPRAGASSRACAPWRPPPRPPGSSPPPGRNATGWCARARRRESARPDACRQRSPARGGRGRDTPSRSRARHRR